MGDLNRGIVVTDFVVKQFPSIKTILSVADGNLILAKELCKLYKVIVYDPNIRNNNKALKRKIKVIGKPFSADTEVKCDLIIGLHPDGATKEIVGFALRTDTPAVIVPCCNDKEWVTKELNRAGYVKFLKTKFVEKGWRTVVVRVSMGGANIAIVAKPKEKYV